MNQFSTAADFDNSYWHIWSIGLWTILVLCVFGPMLVAAIGLAINLIAGHDGDTKKIARSALEHAIVAASTAKALFGYAKVIWMILILSASCLLAGLALAAFCFYPLEFLTNGKSYHAYHLSRRLSLLMDVAEIESVHVQLSSWSKRGDREGNAILLVREKPNDPITQRYVVFSYDRSSWFNGTYSTQEVEKQQVFATLSHTTLPQAKKESL